MRQRKSTTFGFARTARLLDGRVRKASESRGFAQSKLLTQWEEIAGADMAAMARPVEVTYAKGALGATLVLLTTGPNAPLVEMQKDQLRNKVNAVYGYNAISRIRVTQTASTGFADGQVAFTPAPKTQKPKPSPEITRRAHADAEGVNDAGLRKALEDLATQVHLKNAKS